MVLTIARAIQNAKAVSELHPVECYCRRNRWPLSMYPQHWTEIFPIGAENNHMVWTRTVFWRVRESAAVGKHSWKRFAGPSRDVHLLAEWSSPGCARGRAFRDPIRSASLPGSAAKAIEGENPSFLEELPEGIVHSLRQPVRSTQAR